MFSYLIPLMLTLAACFGLQTLALRSAGGKTNKSESNFFSSLGRIQTGVRHSPEIMLLGSSITGRLPDRASGFDGVANLGCDGACAVEPLRAIDEGRLPGAPILVIEGNTLNRALGGRVNPIAQAIDAPWFMVGRRIPNLSATARPAAFFYSRLLARKIGESGTDVGQQIIPTSVPAIPAGGLPTLNEAESQLVDELTALCKRMTNNGISIIITVLPPGGGADSAEVRLSTALAIKARLLFWDLAAGIPAGTIRFTDHVHMDPRSATAVLKTLLRQIRNQ